MWSRMNHHSFPGWTKPLSLLSSLIRSAKDPLQLILDLFLGQPRPLEMGKDCIQLLFCPHKGDIDSAPPKTVTEHFEEIIEKAESFAGTSKQKLAYIFSQFLKIKPTEKNINDMADILGQSEILEPDAKKRRNSARQKRNKD